MNVVKKLIFYFTWRRKLCWRCINIKAIGNYSPCYLCELGDLYEEDGKNHEN